MSGIYQMSVFYCSNEYVFGIGACPGRSKKKYFPMSHAAICEIHFQVESYMRRGRPF